MLHIVRHIQLQLLTEQLINGTRHSADSTLFLLISHIQHISLFVLLKRIFSLLSKWRNSFLKEFFENTENSQYSDGMLKI